jgi:hypothetical protein
MLELVVVVAIVGFLASVAVERLLRYAELAEKGAMEQTVGALKSALSLRFAAFYVQGRVDSIQALSGENPMEWLAEKPAGYLGVLRAPPLADLERPSWYYDSGVRQLVYVPRRTRYLTWATASDSRIRFRVVVQFAPSAETGGAAQLDRLGLDPQPPYEWFATPD